MNKVALIRNSNSFDYGGAEIFPINLAKILKFEGYEPLFLSANKKTFSLAQDAKLKTMHSPWWSYQNFSGFRVFFFVFYFLWQIYLFFWYLFFGIRNHIDVFHPQSRDDFIAATFAAKTLGKKAIWTDHADLKYIYKNHKKWYKNPVGKFVYLASKLADSIMVESYSEKNLVEKALGKALPKKYKVIYLGVVDNYKLVKHDNKNVIFVSTSRLVKAKGIGELIEAFKLIQREKIHLKICGDGPDSHYFRSLAKNVSNIEFLGHVDDVTSILQSSDVLVHPSYHEGFGLSLVEAEMCSLPIIACNVGSIPEIVENGKSGLLIQPKNAKYLADAMNRLAENPKLRTHMGNAGRKIFLEKFQFDKIVNEKIVPLYEK